MARPVRAISASDILGVTDLALEVTTSTSTITISLPEASVARKEYEYRITKVDTGSGKVVIDPSGSELINGQATWELAGQYESISICSNGSGWYTKGFGPMAYFTPGRSATLLTTQQYGARFDASSFFAGTASGAHSWLLGLTGSRTVATVGGDVNDAYLRITGSNYAVNESNYVYRGINSSIINRSPGVVGTMEGATFTADTRSGSTTTTAIGLVAQADIGGTVSTLMLGLDVTLRRQAATNPTTEAGIRIRNRAAGNACDCAIMVRGEDGSIVGFDRFCDMGADQLTLKQTSGKVTLFKINIGGTAYYVRASNSAVSVEANEA